MAKRGWPHVDNPIAVGQRLKKARQDAKLSQRDLAFEGCTAVYICRIEKGQRVPSLQVLRELARRTGVTEDWLAKGEEPTSISAAAEEILGAEEEELQALVELKRWLYAGPENDPVGALRTVKLYALQMMQSRTVPQLNELIELMEAQDQ